MGNITAKIVADSASENGDRITSFELHYPRFILAELNTHRAFSRSTASSRAIPVKKMLGQVLNDPFVPLYWGKNQPGMQANEELEPLRKKSCEEQWLTSRFDAIKAVENLLGLGLHKQIANRLLEPWMWTTTILTATEFGNFYALRDHESAEPHMHALAQAMLAAHMESRPKHLERGQWHLPYVTVDGSPSDDEYTTLIKLSVARCARVSYMNHDGTDPDPVADIALHDRLLEAGHMSPMEHQATPTPSLRSGNLVGWTQYRKTIPGENRAHHIFR
jgi:thymidylate synthase ThyX